MVIRRSLLSGRGLQCCLEGCGQPPSLNYFIVSDPRSRKVKTGTDLAIAAVAIAGEMATVTGNVDDFLVINEVFRLPGLFNPFDGSWAVATGSVDPVPR